MTEEILTHGTRLVRDDGRLRRVIGRDGAVQAVLAWDGDALAAVTVGGYGDATLEVDGAIGAHAVLGPVHALRLGGAAIATMSAVDWRRPSAIPAIDRPAALPPGTGLLLLDVIAQLALDARVPALRYAGPYPTDALWASLAQCFRTGGRVAGFVADAATRWTGLDRSPIAIDFAPAPFERIAVAPGIFAQLRGELDRVVIDGAGYQRDLGVRRLVAEPDGCAAELWFGDRCYATVARFTADGALRTRVPLPPPVGEPVGQVLPAALVDALGTLIVDLVPAPLVEPALAALRATPIEWGDAGAAAAIDRGDRIVLHAGLWHALAPLGRSRLVLALAEALAPIAAARAVAQLSARG